DGQVGSITDDTQMTMFTAEGLIRSHDRGTDPIDEIHQALLRWMVTQGNTAPERFDTTGLAQDVRLNKQRAPGMTCTSALRHPNGLGQPADNNSKGCGTIMRVAPIALMGGGQIEDIAKRASALTHGHATGQDAAAAWALILSAVMKGADPETAATDQIGKFGAETSEAIHSALRAKRNGRPETVESLGGGWIAEEALAIALYATLSAKNFEHGLQFAVTHSGDSDSTGAIAGNLLGLVYPGQVMAHPWRRQIECPDLISRIAQEIDRCALASAD
ncbi:MAG: ADP-ribosylglycohydrolase family protein, partial [Sulfitobacter pontiacus]|uniref:ADP-ribosylglycohydrolase family protein n=1 Tax=Sulfitobacter pontiacus TaxID=60137 RepID=UPI0032998938